VVKKRLQVQGFAEARKHFGETREHRGMLECCRTIWHAEGLRGFYKGLLPSVVKAAPTTAIIFVVYDWSMRRLPENW